MTGLFVQLHGGGLRLFSYPSAQAAADAARLLSARGFVKFAAVLRGDGRVVQRLRPGATG